MFALGDGKITPKFRNVYKEFKSPIIMFALGEAKFGIVFEKLFKFFDGKSAVIISKSLFCSPQVDGRIAVTFSTPLTCLESEGCFVHHDFKITF